MAADDDRSPAGVLFDFSGTLFHIESATRALDAALGPDFADLAAPLIRFGAINGSPTPADLPPAFADVWAERDLSMDAHRAAYGGLGEHAGLTAAQAARLYERGVSADAWEPFPDTVGVLRNLHEAGLPVAVVSNIGWDPRPVLARHGVRDLIDVLVLSYERGVQKPDAAIFRLACAELGVPPERAVMIGDNREVDGAATAAGIRFVHVSGDPSNRRADELTDAVGPLRP